MQTKWHLNDIPDLTGKVYIVTGGNTGLGFKSAVELARKGATVVIACRSEQKGSEALRRAKQLKLQGKVGFIPLNLLESNSVNDFVTQFKTEYQRLDCLLNNAGVVNLEVLNHTQEGHEMHMATNHYGHFMLTVGLFDLLCQTPDSRVVTVSSGAYKAGEIKFDDMDWQQRQYSRVKAYGDSKLANLLFMHALQKKFDEQGCNSISVAAHPGLTATERQQSIGIGGQLAKLLATPVEAGVAPQLRAATDPTITACSFLGPRFGLWGAPKIIRLKNRAFEQKLVEELWQFTSETTGFSLP